MDDQIEAFLASCSPGQLATVQELRSLLKKNVPGAHELVYHDALGYSRTPSPFERVFYISLTATHVTFGFFFGACLDDPQCLLEGNGRRLRHVKLHRMEETGNPALEKLIRLAWVDAGAYIPKLPVRTWER